MPPRLVLNEESEGHTEPSGFQDLLGDRREAQQPGAKGQGHESSSGTASNLPHGSQYQTFM